MHLSNKDWDIVGSLFRKAHGQHIQQSLVAEEERMKRNRPLAFTAILDLIEAMKKDQIDFPDYDLWQPDTIILWQTAYSHTSIALSGQREGYFDTQYPWPDEMLGALYGQG